MRGPAAEVAALPQVKEEEEEEEARPRTATAWRRCGSFRGRRRRTNERSNEGDRGKKSELHIVALSTEALPVRRSRRSYIFSTIYTRDLNISRDNAFVCAKKCRRVLLERRRGREEEIRRMAARRWRTRWRSRLSQAGAWPIETQTRSSSVDPYPPAPPGLPLPFIFSPGLSLRLRSLALRSLPAYVKCAYACTGASLGHLCTKGEERRRKLAGVLLYSSPAFPIRRRPSGVARPRGRQAEKEQM